MSDTRTHAGAPNAGLVLGSYRILHEIARGGMGAVFRAEHVLLGRPAAIKLLRRELSTSAELVQRFVNEARAVTACKHPGIVEIYDFGYTREGHAFIAMELLLGETLGRRLARAALGELEASAIAQGLASALKAAHRVGVIHRDLKPDNVFLVPDPEGGADRSKILDFGIAKLADGASHAGPTTRTGTLIGTPLYMAPEQARAAGAIDPRADLYSLGCILYHMLTGRPPFVAEGAGEIIALQMFGEAVPPGRLAPVSPEMEGLVLRLLEKEPADRFASAGEVVAALVRLDRRATSRMTRPADVLVGDLAASDAAATLPGGDRPPERPPIGPSLRARQADASAVPPAREVPPIAPRSPRRAVLAATAGTLALAIAATAIATRGERPANGGPGAPLVTAPLVTAPPATASPATASPSTTSPTSATVAPPIAAPQTSSVAPGGASPAPDAPPPRAAPATLVPRAPHRPSGRTTAPSVGAITHTAGPGLQDPAPEVHREIRAADRPRPGDHTENGAPIEDTVDLDAHPTAGGPGHRAPPSSPPSKDSRSP